MDPSRALQVLEEAVGAGKIPGAVALVRHRGEIILHEAMGEAAIAPEPRPMTTETVFDLASLTKPVIGGTVALALVDRGVISLDEEVTGWLPELESFRAKGVTYRGLLTHSAGVTGWRPLYAEASSRSEMLAAVERAGLAASPGARFAYSDLGFITLGLALERAGDQMLDQLARELVFEPLGLEHTGYLPSFPPDAYATTERGNAFERRMADWAGISFDGWRTDFHPGEVNDGNTHYGLGGISAHAGLFSDAYDLGVIGEMWLRQGEWNGTRVLSPAVVELATTDQTRTGEGRGLGWALAGGGPTSLEELQRADAGFFPPTDSPWVPRPHGELLSSASFGHTGFTGTTMWVDPVRQLVVVLLTNATHPEVDLNKPVNSIRARFNNAVVASLSSADVLS